MNPNMIGSKCSSGDKAGRTYWEGIWQDGAAAEAVDPRRPGLNNYVYRELHRVFVGILAARGSQGQKLIELGCGNSGWLPYFSREFGFCVHGIDYSDTGCQSARATLRKAGVLGEIVCGDIFRPPQDLIGSFDVVFSFGVAEHFTDTSDCIRAFAAFLRPGGVMVTLIPNMKGLPGLLQKVMDRQVYDIHVPLSPSILSLAHAAAGLNVIQCRYFLPINLNVVNVERRKGTILHRAFVRLRSWTSKAVWTVQSMAPILPANCVTSPYIICVAEKPK